MLKLIIFAMATGAFYVNAENEAIVELTSIKSSSVTGTIKFKQTDDGGVSLEGTITGLSANTKHGLHIHSIGDISDNCLNVGVHLNPFNKTHGAPDVSERHVGDLGNVLADANGVASFVINDCQISLKAGHVSNIIGRSVVIHEGEDDLGLGGYEDSLTTGHAGARIACGVIGIASDDWDWKSAGTTKSSHIVLIATVLISSMFISNL